MRLVHHLISYCFPSFDSGITNCLFIDDRCRHRDRDHRSGVFHGRTEAWSDALG